MFMEVLYVARLGIKILQIYKIDVKVPVLLHAVNHFYIHFGEQSLKFKCNNMSPSGFGENCKIIRAVTMY